MKKIVFFLIVISCLSCSDDKSFDLDCAAVSCLAPTITLEFLSKTTGEDLFLNGTYTTDDLKIVNQSNNEVVNYTIFPTDESIKIYIGNAVTKTELKNYKIFIPDAFDFTLKFEAELTDKNTCCPGTKINNLVVENATYEVDNVFGTYKIFL